MCEDSSCDSLTDPGDRLDLRDALTCDILSVTYGCDCTGCHCGESAEGSGREVGECKPNSRG